eukprot:CAMPEP_0119394652 /NCGR_PEP_ID=MMETSP1334-20130426/130231_1 /TAXON_ID=127549 /ORGANISM="Calcidiscus leptoporus, Strain RCC1130" /LENGTH=177 /DNA_ID=CAMNT_0007417969 /DNA_START=45 /DNA_END=574 /DNA_ORIENTATION=+
MTLVAARVLSPSISLPRTLVHIAQPKLLVIPPANDHAAREFACLARASAHHFAPRGDASLASSRALSLAAAHRVVDRVHGHATHLWPSASPRRCSSLAEHTVLVILIAHHPDRGHAFDGHLAHFARLKAQRCQRVDLRLQLRRAAGGAHHLAAFSGENLHVVHDHSLGQLAQFEGVT